MKTAAPVITAAFGIQRIEEEVVFLSKGVQEEQRSTEVKENTPKRTRYIDVLYFTCIIKYLHL